MVFGAIPLNNGYLLTKFSLISGYHFDAKVPDFWAPATHTYVSLVVVPSTPHPDTSLPAEWVRDGVVREPYEK